MIDGEPAQGRYSTEIRVSPADPRLIYLQISWTTGRRLRRIRDGGASWEVLANGGCTYGLSLFQPHPIDSERFFRSHHCRVGDRWWETVDLSADQGATWAVLFDPMSASVPLEARRLIYPDRRVGGYGAPPERWYVAGYSGSPRIPSRFGLLFRSGDDGGTWSEQARFGPDLCVLALAYDPSEPDHIFVGLESGVMASADGGLTWAELGRRALGRVNAPGAGRRRPIPLRGH